MPLSLFLSPSLSSVYLISLSVTFYPSPINVFPPWHCVKTHPDAPEQQTSALVEVLTPADDQFMKCI